MTDLDTARRGLDRRALLKGAGAAIAGSLLPHPSHAKSGGVTMWTPGGSTLFCDIHKQILAAFAAKRGHPGTSEVVCAFGSGDDYTQRLFGAIAAGNVPDISMLWNSPVSLGAQGAFTPLDDYMRQLPGLAVENWPGALLASCRFRDRTYGLPVTAGVWTMWFNAELFEAKGISSRRSDFPKTWDEMRRMSKAFTVWTGDRLEVAGFMPPRDPAALPIWSALNGGRIFNGETLRYEIDSENNVEMMSFFMSWLEEEYKGDINLVDRSGAFTSGYNDDTTGLGPAFREGRLAGLQSGSWLMGDIWAEPEPTFSRWDLAPHPIGPSGSTTVSGVWPNWFVIPVGSQNADEAAAYLEYLSTIGVVDWFRQIPDVPTNKLVKPVPPKVVVDRRGEAFATDVTAFLQDQAAIVTPMWNSPVEAFGRDQLQLAIGRIYTRSAGVREALADAQKASQAELDRVLSR